jgi:hypothetical protein
MMKPFAIAVFFVLFFLLSCENNSNKNQAVDMNLDREIAERIQRIESYAKMNDTVFTYPKSIDEEVKKVILMSKDIENLQAAVNRGNAYFLSLAKEFKLNIADFEQLNTGMHVDDIGSALKQNEMIFFNHILLKSGTAAVPMHAAQ